MLSKNKSNFKAVTFVAYNKGIGSYNTVFLRENDFVLESLWSLLLSALGPREPQAPRPRVLAYFLSGLISSLSFPRRWL